MCRLCCSDCLQCPASAVCYLEVLWLILPEFKGQRLQATKLGQLQEVESALLLYLRTGPAARLLGMAQCCKEL
jgi:hypothetical protein